MCQHLSCGVVSDLLVLLLHPPEHLLPLLILCTASWPAPLPSPVIRDDPLSPMGLVIREVLSPRTAGALK